MTTDDMLVDVSLDWALASDVQQRFMRGLGRTSDSVDYSAHCRQVRVLGGDFVLFGVALGCLLWQKNKREREFLLTREDLHLSAEAEEIVQFVYQQSQDLQSLVKSRPPSW